MSQIYKLNHIQGEEIKHIYIFSNDISIATPEYVDSQGQPVFTTDEKENIDAKQSKFLSEAPLTKSKM